MPFQALLWANAGGYAGNVSQGFAGKMSQRERSVRLGLDDYDDITGFAEHSAANMDQV